MKEIVVGTERYSVGSSLGAGGEGKVFALSGGMAAKIYHAELRTKREDKVRAMVRDGLALKTNLVAYPSAALSDRHGNFVGFLMRHVAGYQPIHELYSPKSRLRHFPKADYRFVIRAAVNVARAVGKVHQTGCVIGDLNHSGVLVSQNALVALIDADSFQFKTYRCVVGVPDFTPPEFHGIDLGAVERTVDHDNFGLAVAIFQLLFMGRHPYAGRSTGPDLSIGEAIAQNRFAFSLERQSSTQTIPPPAALTLGCFPGPVRKAFEDAFGLDFHARPSALDWIGVLAGLEGALSQCGKVRTHYYPSNRMGCVWCDRADQTGFEMFPDHFSAAPDTGAHVRNTEQAIKEILAFRMPAVSDLLAQTAPAARGGSDVLRRSKTGRLRRAFQGLLAMAGAGAILYAVPPAWVIWLPLGGWGVFMLFGNREVDAKPFQEAFKKADEGVQHELDRFVQRGDLMEIAKVRFDLDAAISSYRSIDGELNRQLEKFRSTREARQRGAFLDRFPIRRARIPGIGPAKAATLVSFGIETAADVNRTAVLGVPGFGNVMTSKLMDWRLKHESRFRYDSRPNTRDIDDERKLRARFAGDKAKLEATIRDGLKTLREAKRRIDALPEEARGHQGLMQALERRSQAEQDLKLLGAPVPTSTVALRFALPIQSGSPTRAAKPQGAQASPSRVIPDCPRCGVPMVRRMARRGPRARKSFWGCSRFPRCSGTRN